MRIIKRFYQVDEDEVQIVYEKPADEECQFIEEKVVNPPSSQSSKASGSRTSVITGVKRPAGDPLPLPRENAAFKKPALEAGNFEQLYLVQPTTSQHSGESTIQTSILWQQPSNSGATEQISLDSDAENSDSVRTVNILVANEGKPIPIYSETEDPQFWSHLSTLQAMNMITHPSFHVVQESIIESDNLHFQSFLNQQREIFEQNNSQGTLEQAINMSTVSNFGSSQESINEENDVANVNQQLPSSEQNSQETEQPSTNMIIEPDIHIIQETINIENDVAIVNQQLPSSEQNSQESINVASDNINSESLMNQQETLEEDNSQNTQQQGVSMITQANANTTQETIDVASENDITSVLAVFSVIGALEQNSEETEQQPISMTAHSNTEESINVANDHGYQFQAIPNQQHPEQRNILETQPQAINGTHTVQESFVVTNDTREPRTFESSNPQRQTTSTVPTWNTAASQGENVSSRNVLLNQISQVAIPIDLTLGDDLIGPHQSILTNSPLWEKTSQHLVWNGSVRYPKRQNGSQVLQSLNCIIYGLRTVSGNMNVNADLWPRQLKLVFLPSNILLKQDLYKDLKNINRHTTIYFAPPKGTMLDPLQKGLIYGLVGCIRFPPPCSSDIMIVLHIRQKSTYVGFIANNESGFITKLTDVFRKYNLEKLKRKSQPSGSNQAQTLPRLTSFLESVRQQASFNQSPPQPTCLLQSAHQQTSLIQYSSPFSIFPLPAHQQFSPQLTHQQTNLPLTSHQQLIPQLAHQQTGLPLTSHQQTGLPLTSHQQTGLPLTSHQQTGLPLTSHQETGLPLTSHQQPGFPICQCPLVACLTQCPQRTHQSTRQDPLQTSVPQSSHLPTRSSTVLKRLPRTQRLLNLFQLAGSLEERVVSTNKYETVDRHIDDCISKLRRRTQVSDGSGPCSSQQAQTSNQQVMRQDSGTSNEPLPMTSGEAPENPKLVESKASEIFSPSLVKKVIKKRWKTSRQSFTSLNELCEEILSYEESKRKSKESKKSKHDVNEALLCKICMDDQMNVVFEPCGHLSTCLECSRSLDKCPMCRTLITNKRKIYMS